MCLRLLTLAVVVAAVVADGRLRGSKTIKTSRRSKAAGGGEEKEEEGGGGLCDPNVVQYKGYYDIDSTTHKNYFYWAFESRRNPSTDPVILWMTGGPGCSSELALFVENGPCKLTDDLVPRTTLNNYSWNEAATVIYIDQPSGVGFSYSDAAGFDKNEEMVSNDMYNFLQAFYHQNPQFRSNELFIYGESYGGHYAPAVAHRIYLGNKLVRRRGTDKNVDADVDADVDVDVDVDVANATSIYLPLAGLSVGNGLTDPEVQYAYFPYFTYNYTKKRLGKPVISLADYETMQAAVPGCVAMIRQCQTGSELQCAAAQATCNDAMLTPYINTGLNVYDIRKPCIGSSLCYNFTAMDRFLKLESTRKYLGVPPNVTWERCNDQVNVDFAGDWMKNFQNQIPDLLANGIRVLIYAGDVDFICNWIGNKMWTLMLDWPHKADFQAAPDKSWKVQGVDAGVVRTASNFTFLQVYNAGHMVPMDQPVNALEMVKLFLTGGTFSP